MSKHDLRYIKGQGISLGSHTVTHASVKKLDQRELFLQINKSRETLTELGESFHAFSYPWGKWSDKASEVLKASGYECALIASGAKPLKNIDVFRLPRITMTGDMNLKKFEAIFGRTNHIMRVLRGSFSTLRSYLVPEELE